MRVWGLIGFRILGFRVSGSKPKVWGKGVGTKLGALPVRIRFGDILYYISIIKTPNTGVGKCFSTCSTHHT